MSSTDGSASAAAMARRAALMNAAWDRFPEYAAACGAREQSGWKDLPGLTRIHLGEPDIEFQKLYQ